MISLFAVLKTDLLKIGRYVDSQAVEVEKQNVGGARQSSYHVH